MSWIPGEREERGSLDEELKLIAISFDNYHHHRITIAHEKSLYASVYLSVITVVVYLFMYFFIYLLLSVTSMLWCVSEGQSATPASQFSPTLWVPKTKLRMLGLAPSSIIHWSISLVPYIIFKPPTEIMMRSNHWVLRSTNSGNAAVCSTWNFT